MPITLATVGWVEGRTATMRWPEDFPAEIAAGTADRLEIEWRGLTVGEELYMADVLDAVTAERGSANGERDPVRAWQRRGMTRYLVELFRVGVVAIRGLYARTPDGGVTPHTPARAPEDGFPKLSLELAVALRREYPGLVEVVANRIFEATRVGEVEKKASSPASGPAPSASGSTADVARESSGRLGDAGIYPPTSAPPCPAA